MKYIQKGSVPKELTAYLKTPGASYDGCPYKEEWSKVLLKEQGYLCAYTLRRIKLGELKKEHLNPQNGTIKNDLSYKNIVAVCKGNEGYKPEYTYADTRKGNQELDKRLYPTNPKISTESRSPISPSS